MLNIFLTNMYFLLFLIKNYYCLYKILTTVYSLPKRRSYPAFRKFIPIAPLKKNSQRLTIYSNIIVCSHRAKLTHKTQGVRMRHHHAHQCTPAEQAISRQVGPHSSLYCSQNDDHRNNINVNICDPAVRTISRQVGPRSQLYCHSCTIELGSPSSGCGPVEHAISRQVGPRSQLYFHDCHVEVAPAGECSPASLTISRLVGPHSPLFCG